MAPTGNGQASNDDSFIAFCFAIVSVAMIILYIPWLWNLMWSLIGQLTSSRKRRDGLTAVDELVSNVTYVPRVALRVLSNPAVLIAGAKALIAMPNLSLRLYVPKFLRFILRPKILALWLWILLLSMVMYTSFTFDAHGVLGLKNDASMSDIKKAYRQLSKKYHPDQNSTEAARVLYHQVRRAYKALVNKEEFEEEASKEDYSVGVALPSFLTNKDNEFFVLFGMLALMLGIPITLYLRFRDSDRKLPTLLEKFKKEQEFVPRFLELLGVPKDQKYVEKKLSRTEIVAAIKGAGLGNAALSENLITGFPLFPAFISKFQNPAPHIGYLKGLGFDDEAIKVMGQWAETNGPRAVENYEARVREICGDSEAPKVITTTPAQYQAIKYLLEIHTENVADQIEELQKHLPAEVRATRKIISTHNDMYDLMVYVFEREKPLPRHIQGLTDIAQQLEEAYEELIPDIEKVMRKHYRQAYEQQVGKKALKQMQRAAARAPQQQ